MTIGVKVYKSLRNIGPKQKKLKDWQDFVEIFLFSILSYAIYGLIIYFISLITYNLFSISLVVMNIEAFFKKDLSGNDINYFEILFTSIISAGVAILLAYLSNEYFLFKMLNGAASTKHYGDEDVWAYLFHTKRIGYVVVRDHNLELAYFGFVEFYSDDRENRELLLKDVVICKNNTGEILYKLDRMYISRNEHDLTIDIPDDRFYLPEIEKKGKKNDRKNHNSRK